MLTQYQDCFSEVSRQTRWYRDLREAYQELRLHAENIKREALMSVSVSQREIESLRRQCQAQSLQICRLKEQVWEAEMGRQRAESEMEDLQGRISNYSQQISHFQSRLESLQTQLKETQTRMAISQEQVELQQLREFRDRWERAARSLADIDQQDKDCWSGLQWCESSESEDSQKREAKLEATLGLLMVEAGRRRRADASDAAPKDCDCASTDDSGSTKAHNPTSDPAGQPSQPDESQGQLQGVLDENQQLRNQLGQLRAHNASLAAQLQEQCEESARCLADITSSLEADAEAEPGLPGRASGMSGMSPRGGRDRGSRRGPPATPATPATPPAAGLALATLVAQPVHTSLAAFPSTDRLAPTAPRRPAVGAPTAPTAAPGRASRARSSSGSSGGGGSTRRGGHRRRPPASLSPEGPEGPEADAGDYSDPADLCDSGFWSLQASPPRSASAMASVLAPSPAPARLCWLGQPPSPTPGGSQAQAPRLTASGATAFILNAHRPRPSRH